MKLLILSDLHLEHCPIELREQDCDVVILAGDIHGSAAKAVDWAKDEPAFACAKAIIYVPGNKEFHGATYPRVLRQMYTAALGSNVHPLHCNDVVIEGVRFLGCTLWTDFALGIETTGGLISNTEVAMEVARRVVPDFEHIGTAHPSNALDEFGDGKSEGRFTPEHALALHQEQCKWLQEKLRTPFSGPTVVVTHHAPNPWSAIPNFSTDWVSASFTSDLPTNFFNVPVLWVHGHTHAGFEYYVKDCRVIANPRGYASQILAATKENPVFDPAFIIEV